MTEEIIDFRINRVAASSITPNEPGDTQGNIPDVNPPNEGSLIGLLQTFYNKMVQNTDGMLPAKVIAYDRTTNRVSVQPLIAIVSTDDTVISRSQIASLPVLQLGGGGYGIFFNLVPGDLGWILANDRDISLFLQEYKESSPNTLRKKSFSDALFIPQILVNNYNIAEEDAENMVIQNTAGTVRIALWPTKIKITAPEGLEVEGPITANGGISVSGGSGFTVTGNMNLTGDIAVTGNITATGDITPHVPP